MRETTISEDTVIIPPLTVKNFSRSYREYRNVSPLYTESENISFRAEKVKGHIRLKARVEILECIDPQAEVCSLYGQPNKENMNMYAAYPADHKIVKLPERKK